MTDGGTNARNMAMASMEETSNDEVDTVERVVDAIVTDLALGSMTLKLTFMTQAEEHELVRHASAAAAASQHSSSPYHGAHIPHASPLLSLFHHRIPC